MSKIILNAEDLDGYLTAADKDCLVRMDKLYKKVMVSFSQLGPSLQKERRSGEENLIPLYNEMGVAMQEICAQLPHVHVYTFKTPQEGHPEVSRLIAKLRDVRTGNQEFVY
jgi:uracil phosphoribosyltransferase